MIDRRRRSKHVPRPRRRPTACNVYEEDAARAAGAVHLERAEEHQGADRERWRASLGFAFSLIDLTPAERLVWVDKHAGADQAAGRRALPARRARPARRRAGDRAERQLAGRHDARRAPDACWRLDMVRDERPGRPARATFARAGRAARLRQRPSSRSPTAKIAAAHAAHLPQRQAALHARRALPVQPRARALRARGHRPRRLPRPLHPPAAARTAPRSSPRTASRCSASASSRPATALRRLMLELAAPRPRRRVYRPSSSELVDGHQRRPARAAPRSRPTSGCRPASLDERRTRSAAGPRRRDRRLRHGGQPERRAAQGRRSRRSRRYFKFWTDDLRRRRRPRTRRSSPTRLLYRLLQTTTVDLIKFDYPTVYALMRLIGVIEQDLRLTLEEAFAPEVAGEHLHRQDYWRRLAGALRAQLPALPARPGSRPSCRRRARRRAWCDRQLGLRVFGLSDLGAWRADRLPRPGASFDGTDVAILRLGDAAAPAAAARAAPSRAGVHPARRPHREPRLDGARHATATGRRRTLTQLLLRGRRQDRLGWLLSLRGAVALEQALRPAARPIKVKATVDAARPGRVGRAALQRRVDASGRAGGAAATLEIAPAQTSNRAPAVRDPRPDRHALEIGDFSFKGELSNDEASGSAVELRKSALVIVSQRRRRGSPRRRCRVGETRIEFDLGLTIDTEHGAYLDGGGRLATTIAVNKSVTAACGCRRSRSRWRPSARRGRLAELRLRGDGRRSAFDSARSSSPWTASAPPRARRRPAARCRRTRRRCSGRCSTSADARLPAAQGRRDRRRRATSSTAAATSSTTTRTGQYAGVLQLSLGKR